MSRRNICNVCTSLSLHKNYKLEAKLKHQKETCRKWKQGEVTWEENRDIVLSIWGRSYARQSLSGIESGRGYQRQQEGFLYVDR